MRGVVALSALGPILAIALGLYLYLSGGRFISTDNAYVKSDKIAVSADVSGRVFDVMVRTNQRVKPGTILFSIDPEPFQIAVERSKAQLLAARQESEALKALYHQKLATLNQARVDLSFFERRYNRQKKLIIKALASQSTVDAADQNLKNTRAQINVLKHDLEQVLAKLGGSIDRAVEELPDVMAAAATLKQAKLNLKRTEVQAPVDGVITNFDLQKGEYVEAGQVTFSIVATSNLWVKANFRETDLTHMHVGQAAKIRIDAYPQEEFEANVSSIDPATGAEFALLPPQNATGNWVKVVQRLSVWLKLKNAIRDPPLRAGMSLHVEVDTNHQRSFGGLLRLLQRWVGG